MSRLTPFANWRVDHDNDNWMVIGSLIGRPARIAVGLDERTSRLIAAAPALLEALEQVVRYADGDVHADPASINVAKAAIAQAKGEQP